MSKRTKTIIPTAILAVGLACGSFVYKNNVGKNKNTISNNETSLLSYSKTDLTKASNELKQLKIRTYTDLEWGKNGRKKYFRTWEMAKKYNYKNVPNTCYVRDAILILQSLSISYTDKCEIYYGKWKSPYTSNIIYTKSDIQIDHIVPLKEVWNSGGNNWLQSKRLEYANTEQNLLISENTLNKNKGDDNPYKWMPPQNKCGYIIKWIDIKYIYKLTTTKQESVFLKKQISFCH